jgi:micrococcal nuclease
MENKSTSDVIDFSKCVNQLKVEAYVDSVYDGDSLKVIFPFHGVKYKWTCRLNGIDTPEIRTSNTEEKQFGLKVRDIVREKVLNKKLTILCHTFDKYGRLLIDIYLNKKDMLNEHDTLNEPDTLNEWLIKEKYALSYDGGKKQSWTEMLTIIGH